jgi:bla regulator protein BlaR1
MAAISQNLGDVFGWLIRSSFEATLLLAVILLIRLLVRRRLHFRMVYWLWILLLVRLIWPFHLQTAFSVFNLIPHQMEPTVAAMQSIEAKPGDFAADELPASANGVSAVMPAAVSPDDQPEAKPVTAAVGTLELLSVCWLAGAGLLGGWVLLANYRLWRIVKRERLVTRQGILDLLEDCKAQLGLQTVIGIAETANVTTPCLFGYLRPRLLLPEGILDEMEQEELRYVFLHELAHLKRHDILIGWLMAVVQVLHWFNPAVWFAMGQISRDRELACDELALSRLDAHESKAYGQTILTFLERFSRHQKLPAMAGIAENQSLLKRRIMMIAQFKNRKISWLPVLAIILILLATTFTSAQSRLLSASMEQASDKPASTKNANSGPEMLVVDDGKQAGKKSIAGSGHVVRMEPDGEVELLAVRIYGSRYGTPQPPQENFYVWIADENQDVLETFEFPYGTIKRGDPKWYNLKTKPTKLPKQFYLCVGFNPGQTKGVFVHYDAEASGKSFTGLPHDNEPFKLFDGGDWMIRAVVRPTAAAAASASAANGLQAMIDAAEAGSTVAIPDGVYTEPVTINKPLVLKGASRDGCIFKVTADRPAVFIDTAGGFAVLQDVTIQWQLASSDQHETPFAVAVKDTTAEIINCVFRPLGNAQRSPVAVRSIGFAEMDLMNCDFTGFDYVVCYGEGTKGKMEDCFVRDCGHQGVILYSGAEAELVGNIITGSGFHAVRTTGGKLGMRDNLIINNKNRGVYLGNRSGSGAIINNLLIGNATGIDGISASRFSVQHNIILNSTYAAIAARPFAELNIQGNVLSSNERGVIVHQEEGKSDPVQSKLASNVYWKNKTDVENIEKGDGAINAQPDFVDAANGNYKLTGETFKNVGLRDPEKIYYLWKKYQEKR